MTPFEKLVLKMLSMLIYALVYPHASEKMKKEIEIIYEEYFKLV